MELEKERYGISPLLNGSRYQHVKRIGITLRKGNLRKFTLPQKWERQASWVSGVSHSHTETVTSHQQNNDAPLEPNLRLCFFSFKMLVFLDLRCPNENLMQFVSFYFPLFYSSSLVNQTRSPVLTFSCFFFCSFQNDN